MQELHLLTVILYKIIVIAAIINVLMDNRQPAKTMAWVLVIYFVPIIGVIFYFFFGINTRRKRLVSQRSIDQLTKRSMLEFVEQQDFKAPERYEQLIKLFVNQNMALPFKNNQTQIITDGSDFFLSLLRDIGSAQNHIHLNIYIFANDAIGRLIADALIDKALAGVEVRVIYDDVGCWNVPNRFFERMREAGIEVSTFLPVRFPLFTSKVNYRNHRKMVVIDGHIGYIGGMNIALRYAKGTEKGPWRDTMVRMEGGAVYGLQRAFLVDWYFVDRTQISDRRYYPPVPSQLQNDSLAQIVTSSPATAYPEIMQGYLRIILSAKEYIYLQTPYFLPTDSVLMALKTAALSSVDVRVMIPRHSDSRFIRWASRAFLEEMEESGVKIYLYDKGFLHSKMLVCDDQLASCGSTNIDSRSFENNFEANVFFYHTETALRFKKIFLEDQQLCTPLEQLSHRYHPRFIYRLWESVIRLLAPLL